ncbi:MAG: FtsQ-type POTRA domain-containing protein [Verrucomicrobiota bacterium JB022]|nr:FtsQ-type POTRA domain-containing protein [Verrucomicrobiota bacterium JB022]
MPRLTDPASDTVDARNWRTLQQQKARRKVRPQTEKARMRRRLRAMRIAAYAFLVCALLGGTAWTIWFAGENWAVVTNPTPKGTLDHIQVTTDGVLTRDWVIRQLALPEDVKPLDLDLFALKATLEDQPQISGAELRLELPGTLHIDVQEREPLLRVRTQWPDGRYGVALIARDGTVYEGYNYSRERLMRLPGATGIPLTSTGPGRYAPVYGMDVVAEFLETAANRTPELWQDWRAISLERFSGDVNAPDALITVYGNYVKEWVFSPSGDFPSQLAAARQLYLRAKSSRVNTLALVDVSYPEHAVVRLP